MSHRTGRIVLYLVNNVPQRGNEVLIHPDGTLNGAYCIIRGPRRVGVDQAHVGLVELLQTFDFRLRLIRVRNARGCLWQGRHLGHILLIAGVHHIEGGAMGLDKR